MALDMALDSPKSNASTSFNTVDGTENVDVRYRENLPLVLKGINCAIATREKVKSGTHQRKFIFTIIEVTHENPRFS